MGREQGTHSVSKALPFFALTRKREEFGLKKLQQEVLIVMPRRRGKTYSVAMAAAAVILCVPGCSVAVFSTGERIAHALMKVVLSFIDKAFALGTIKKSQYRVGTSNK